MRAAGGLLILHGLLDILEIAVMPDTVGAARGNLTVILDMVIGVSLVRGSDRLVTLALARVAFALVLQVVLPLTRGETLLPLFQATWCAALLLVLVGRAGRPRIVAGCVVFAGYVVLQGRGLYGVATGRDLLWRLEHAMDGEMTPAPTEVVGTASAYRLRVPADGWYVWKAEAARRDNPLVDVWLVRPDLGAHVLVIDEVMPDAEIDAVTDAVLANIREGTTNFRGLENRALPAYPLQGRIMTLATEADGEALVHRIAVVVGGGRSYQVLGFTTQAAAEAAEAELVRLLESFRLPGS